jgi:hypothetical protein
MSAKRKQARKYSRDLAKAKSDITTQKIMNRYHKKLAEYVAINDVTKLREMFNDDTLKMSQTDRKALMYAMLNLSQKEKDQAKAKEEADKVIDNTN